MNPHPLSRQFPAHADQVSAARRAVVAYAREHGADDPDAIALAVSEAMSNAVIHAFVGAPGPGTVQVTAQRFADDGIEILVSDDGRGLAARADSPGLGLGLPLMCEVSERLELAPREGGGTCVRMRFGAH